MQHNITSQHKPAVVTIGTFDGVHIGHQKIIERLTKIAYQKQLEASLLTFFPHPRMVLQKDANIKLINTMAEKEVLLKHYGIDNIIVKQFTKAFSRLTALEFVRDVLVGELNTKHIIIGYDHRFGKNRSANIEDLKHYGTIFGFEVDEISAQDINSVAVSSTKIRTALLEGDIATAISYLGHDFTLSGTVVKGQQIGKTIGYPTANIDIEESYKLIPKKGVYIISCNYNDTLLYGIMNIGTNPTLKGEHLTIEAHFFNFEGSLYGEHMSVNVLHRLRDEQKFNSVEDLKQQIKNDQNNAYNYINNML